MESRDKNSELEIIHRDKFGYTLEQYDRVVVARDNHKGKFFHLAYGKITKLLKDKCEVECVAFNPWLKLKYFYIQKIKYDKIISYKNINNKFF
jgi:hypothetical protein